MLENFEDSQESNQSEKEIGRGLHRSFNSIGRLTDSDFDGRPNEKAEYQVRLDESTTRLRKIDGLDPKKWKEMDIYERKATLNAVGRELQEVYHHPAPPMQISDLGDQSLLGAYGDGHQFNSDKDAIEGSDYGINLNERGSTGEESLFGDDPRAALKTYTHEFRHSYQTEQARRVEDQHFRNLVDDPEPANAWSRNFQQGNYISPDQDYEAYRNQPVEIDARSFADELVKKVYENWPS